MQPTPLSQYCVRLDENDFLHGLLLVALAGLLKQPVAARLQYFCDFTLRRDTWRDCVTPKTQWDRNMLVPCQAISINCKIVTPLSGNLIADPGPTWQYLGPGPRVLFEHPKRQHAMSLFRLQTP